MPSFFAWVPADHTLAFMLAKQALYRWSFLLELRYPHLFRCLLWLLPHSGGRAEFSWISEYCLPSNAKIFSFWSFAETSFMSFFPVIISVYPTFRIWVQLLTVWSVSFYFIRISHLESFLMLVLPHSNPVPLCPLHNGTSSVSHHSYIRVLNHLAKIYWAPIVQW